MIAYAADATWGVSGPTFLLWYLGAAGAVAVLATVHRRIVLGGPGNAATAMPAPQQAAYLNNGERLAGYTALAGLRAASAIGAGASRKLTQAGPLPAGATRLDAAVYQAAGRGLRAGALAGEPGVRAAMAQLRQELEAAGLLTTAGQRRAVRLWALAGAALTVLGVLRVIAGIDNGRPVGFLVASIVPVVILSLFLRGRAPTRTRAGAAVLADLRREHAYLAPANNPSYPTYGVAGAAMGVALYGTASLYLMDPAFAAGAAIQRQTSAAGSTATGGSSCSTASSCSSSSSSCSSSSSSSSCGGGGCGG